MSRTASLDRSTRETQIHLELNLDGTGQVDLHTGVGFFDHMLELLARHGSLDLTVKAKGDLHVDAHHTVEDVGICLGQAIRTALGEQGWNEGAQIEGVGLDKIMARVGSRSPLGRLGTVEQVARMALFIASDDCSFTTGAAFNVDGGIVMG